MAAAKRAKGWTFDLAHEADGKIYFLSAWIWNEQASRVDAGLRSSGSSLEKAMTDGMHLHVKGMVRSWEQSGEPYLEVKFIQPGFRNDGALHQRDQQALRNLAASYPMHQRLRLKSEVVHQAVDSSFENLDVQEVMLISPSESQGAGDFNHHRKNASRFRKTGVQKRSINWLLPSAVEDFRTLTTEAQELGMDLIAIVQGGGHWRFRRIFEREDLARAILESPVPVATGIGHAQNVSLADRAAVASFATPSSLHEAIDKSKARLSTKLWLMQQGTLPTRKKTAPTPPQQPQDTVSLAELQARLSMAQAENATLRAQSATQNSSLTSYHQAASRIRQRHILDLLEMSTRRVVNLSRMATTMTVAVLIICLISGERILNTLGLPTDVVGWVAYHTVLLICGWLILRAQYRSRKRAGIVSPKE